MTKSRGGGEVWRPKNEGARSVKSMAAGMVALSRSSDELSANVAALSDSQSDLAVFLHREEIRPGYRMREHRLHAHLQGHGRVKGKTEHRDILS